MRNHTSFLFFTSTVSKVKMFLLIFFSITVVVVIDAGYLSRQPLDQATTLMNFRISSHLRPVPVPVPVPALGYDELTKHHDRLSSRIDGATEKQQDSHLLKDGLPGHPASGVKFKQYAGNINVDKSRGRVLFYYLAESAFNSSMKPLILWLNGGPGCSSLGIGAFTEVGPFGVNPDGKTLYARKFAWNQVANVLFLESPAGVGFSYSNTSNDYKLFGDQRTADDTYVFLMNWFRRYTEYQGRDFYIIGESYAGHYIPQLADLIFANSNSTPMMNLKGIMIGNGLIDDLSDTRGLADYVWSHALASDENHEDLRRNCHGSLHPSNSCSEAFDRAITTIGNINYFNIYSPLCEPSLMNHPPTGRADPCDILFVSSYLNLPQVQEALNANRTKLPYPWGPCSTLMHTSWNDRPPSMIPVYKRLMAHRLHILLYSGDVDACVPVTSTRYALASMGLKVIKPWHWWSIPDTLEIAGYKVVYDGLTYVTVRGAGHEVSLSHPDRLYTLLNNFLGQF